MSSELIFPIEGLAVTTNNDDVWHADTLALFAQSARRVQMHYQLAATDLPDVVQVCQLVGGMPYSLI